MQKKQNKTTVKLKESKWSKSKRKLLFTVSAFQNQTLFSHVQSSSLETMWSGSRVKSIHSLFSVCLFFNRSASRRVQQWNKMSGSRGESTSICWPADSILMLPRSLHRTKGPLCALASQRCTPSSRIKKHVEKQNQQQCPGQGACLQPYL